MSPFFAKNFVNKSIRVECPFLVATPTRDTLLAEEVYRSCTMIVGQTDTTVDQMLLDMIEFDIILGID